MVPIRRLLIAGMLATAASFAHAADAPEKTPVAPAATGVKPNPRSTVIPQAIAALTKEYKAYEKDPKSRLRDKSDYFKESPSPDATPEAIVKALEANVPGGSGVEAYVKWQLLSGHPDKFAEPLAKRVLAVYRRAPGFVMHPGMNKKVLTKAAGGLSKGDVVGVQKQLDEAIEQNDNANYVFVSYRDELYSRLPATPEVFAAGLEDIARRATAGVSAANAFSNVAAAVKSWALLGATPQQLKAMSGAVSRLAQLVAHEDNKPYTQLTADVKWKAAPVVDAKKMDELVKFLDSTAANPAGGPLKFKD